ncbi:hypothetical protein T265_08617 [Opisthorchis viverrini]|uniref:Uncharacterized protein n=1 Tax=Opisthorchis viverrini TaxID=6198 RepID=A0A074Z8N5_OPIVI|nr:hypothetical protein T265_08617 [Opisthorchis viverrini]KER23493.1 hypothetical protein T265_08617 [Opisthorchis viverrini]
MNPTKVVDFGPCRGRGIVAARGIQAGETLFTEVPLLCCQFSWNRLYGYQACDHCLCPLESAQANARRLTGRPDLILPQPECGSLVSTVRPTHCPQCGVTYCTPECMQSAADTYHAVICPKDPQLPADHPFTRLDELWRQLHYPPESSTIFLLVRIVGACLSASVFQSTYSIRIISILQTFVCCTTETNLSDGIEHAVVSHKLLLPDFTQSLQQLHTAFSDVLYYLVRRLLPCPTEDECLRCMQQAGVDRLLTLENFKTALCMLGRNGQGIATSAFSLWAREIDQLISGTGDEQQISGLNALLADIYEAMDNHVGSFLDNEGVGLYEYQIAQLFFRSFGSPLHLRFSFQRCAAICPCFGGSTGDEERPRDTHQLEDIEARRQRQAEAAERRLATTQARGLADPEGVKRKQERAREQEKMSFEHKADTGLRWQVG